MPRVGLTQVSFHLTNNLDTHARVNTEDNNSGRERETLQVTSGASGSKDEGRERSGQSPCVVHKDAAGNSFQPDVPNSQKVYRHLKINTPLSASKTMNDKAGAPSLHLCIVGFLTSTTCRYQFSKHKVGVSWSSLAAH